MMSGFDERPLVLARHTYRWNGRVYTQKQNGHIILVGKNPNNSIIVESRSRMQNHASSSNSGPDDGRNSSAELYKIWVRHFYLNIKTNNETIPFKLAHWALWTPPPLTSFDFAQSSIVSYTLYRSKLKIQNLCRDFIDRRRVGIVRYRLC